jgi:deoxyribodipyrimidine photolyase-related protein
LERVQRGEADRSLLVNTLWFLEDHLSLEHPGWGRVEKGRDRLLFIESQARAGHLPYHKKRQVFLYSAMRHFAEERRREGWKVEYHTLAKTKSVEEVLRKLEPEGTVFVMEPNNLWEMRAFQRLEKVVRGGWEVLENTLFLVTREDFLRWAEGKKRLLMESHYRRLRVKLGLLVDEQGEPEGGRWNFDAENRSGIKEWKKAGSPGPETTVGFAPDAITRQVMQEVEEALPDHPGSVAGFAWAVTREQALRVLEKFVHERLGHYGTFQDLMVTGQPTLFHAMISPALNLGLLGPLECVQAAVDAYKQEKAPLAAVEAFVRQIIGWREFVRGVYWRQGEAYAGVNALGAERPLPEFFWTGETDLGCLRETLQETLAHGFNHHIQRLMILGNFCLLAGIQPQEVLRWFSAMYLDAHEWVMAANVLGMALHADGGLMATKPYAGAAAYISRMSNYCESCRFDPNKKVGPGACPFNLMYWNFYDQHAERFAHNPRTSMPVRSWMKRNPEDRARIVAEAGAFLEGLPAS